MADYDDTNRWRLFKVKEKKNPKGPDYSGPINIDGVEYRLSAWLTKSKSGETYFSGQVEPAKGNNKRELEDEIPF